MFPVSWLWGREKLAHGGKRFTYECASCGKQTSVTAGTILHGSKLPLTVWFWASYLMSTHSDGISALQLQEQLALGSYKTAWLLAAKLRRAMTAPDRGPLAGIVEIDETTLPLRGKDEPLTGGGGRSRQGKMLLAGAVEIDGDGPGRIRLGKIETFSRRSLHGFVAAKCGARRHASRLTVGPPVPARPASITILTSSAPWPLMSCCHGPHRVFANSQTWALGVDHGLRDKHLQSYLDEFVFLFTDAARVTPPSAHFSQSPLPLSPSHTRC